MWKKRNLWTDPSGTAGLTFEYVTPAHNTCRWEEQLEFLASSFKEGRNKRKNMEKERALWWTLAQTGLSMTGCEKEEEFKWLIEAAGPWAAGRAGEDEEDSDEEGHFTHLEKMTAEGEQVKTQGP